MAVTLRATGTASGYGAAIAKPAGAGTTPCIFVCTVAWFFNFGTPSMSGWNLVTSAEDGRGSDKTCHATFWKAVTDPSTEPSTYTFSVTSGGDWLGQITAWDGVDSTNPVPSGGFSTDGNFNVDTITLPAATVNRAGSAAVLGCGAWGFNEWVANTPSGWTQTAGTGGSEFGAYYRESLSSNTGATFPNNVGRFACVLTILQPPNAIPRFDKILPELSGNFLD